MYYSETLPKAPASAARARRLLEPVRRELSPRTFEDARLLVTELVANTVEHVREEGDIEVRVQLFDGVLRVEVLDPGPGFTPVPRQEDDGWGLEFIAQIASRWAADRHGRARVWFELDREALP